MKFGDRLRLLRESRGLTQTELAAMCRTSQYMMSYWETRDYAPAGQLLIDLCKALKVSADYLVGLDDEYAGKPVAIDLIALLHSPQPLTANSYELSKEAREAIASTVENFASLIGVKPKTVSKGDS